MIYMYYVIQIVINLPRAGMQLSQVLTEEQRRERWVSILFWFDQEQRYHQCSNPRFASSLRRKQAEEERAVIILFTWGPVNMGPGLS